MTVRAMFRKILALMSVLSALYESGPIGGGYWANAIEEAAIKNADTTANRVRRNNQSRQIIEAPLRILRLALAQSRNTSRNIVRTFPPSAIEPMYSF
jgi:hypothetical protein